MRALITGIAGQDGSYLADLLLSKGYEVVGVRRPDNPDISRLEDIADRIELREADLLDLDGLVGLLRSVQPTEVYNLAGHSFVPTSWESGGLTGDATGVGAERILEAIAATDSSMRFYQASTSEIFGNVLEAPQDESTPLNPRNPYGEAKAHAHTSTVRAREERGLFAVSGILYNHESPRRGTQFVTRKVTRAAAAISLGLETEVMIGSFDARRDWGFARDYVDAMWRMLQQPEPGDYVVATGLLHSVGDLCEIAFRRRGLDYRDHVREDPAFQRPPEQVPLVGDASKARRALGWAPTVTFEELIEMMVDADVELLRAGPASS